MKTLDRKNGLAEKAVKYFRGGYNCSQSVLLTMFEHWNGRNELVPKMATAFGGGIGRCGSVCGALTGGVLAIGTKYGTNEPSMRKRLKAYELANKLYKRFEKQNGSVLCLELIGYDLSDTEQLKKAREANVFEEKCPVFVKKTIEILLRLDEGKL